MSDIWIRKMKTYFQRNDFDKDGTLTKNDYVEHGKRFAEVRKLDEENGNALKKQLLEVWSMFSGGNEDVVLSEDDFIRSLKAQIADPAFNETLAEPMKIVFATIDANGDGRIDVDELGLFFESFNLGNDLAPVSFKALDTDGDGAISLDEFIAGGQAFFTCQDEEHPSKFFLGPLI